MKELLGKLVDAYGPSGYESPVRNIIQEEVKEFADKIYTDNLGNLMAIRKGDKPALLLTAHMDEVGLIVTHIDEKGFLRPAAVGGLNVHRLPAQRFIFANGTRGTLYHEKIKELKELVWDKLYLDIGTGSLSETAKKVKVGDMAVPDYPMQDLGVRYLGKAMDNRAGCCVLIETMKRLPRNISREIVFLFTVQEELGNRGARTAAYHLQPGMAIVVDVTPAGDTPEPPRMDISLGKGPSVKIKDASVIVHHEIKELLINTAIKENIPYQLEVLVQGGTDTGVISLSREGVRAGAISIPCRYLHTSSEMVDITDMEGAVKILSAVCSGL